VRVVAPDVGGGFGVKTGPYREDVLLAWLARRLARPVKWVATRREDQATTNQARGSVCEGALALDADGRILGLRARIASPLGSSLMNAAAGSPWNHARLLPGAYVIPGCDIAVSGAVTTTAPVAAYRGAGRPEACFYIERLIDTAARALGLDPAELRKRNLIPADRFPFRTVTGQSYDSGDYPQALERALATADYARLRREQAERRARGEVVGIGVVSYVEPCALGWESGSIKVERSGRVTAITGSSAHGQGHETTFAQVVAERLGIAIENVSIVHGDTDKVQFGMGTYGSRSGAVGISAIVKALDKIEVKAKKVAAHLLEAAEGDIVFQDGKFTVAGTDKSAAWGDVTLNAYIAHKFVGAELEPGLKEGAFYDPVNFTFPAGCHICEVEVDPQTGESEIVAWTAVDDFGTVINPMIVEGQVHGGIAQGVGQALLEGVVYDKDGQLVTGSLMDYCMPRAHNLPTLKVDTTTTKSPSNPLGIKGCGEAGAIAAPVAVINAITDAIGTEDLAMPATAQAVWQALQKVNSRRQAA